MGSSSTEAITALASVQHGAFSVDQLDDVSVTRRWVANLARRGAIVRAAPGVYVIAGSSPTWHRDVTVGLLALGERSWVSHEAAARLHELDRTPEDAPAEFTVERVRRGRTVPFTVHSTRLMSPGDVVKVGGFRATSATRTILDLARAGAPRDRLAAAIDSAVRSGLTAPVVLRTRLEERRGRGHWGAPLLDELLPDAGGHTMLERKFLELVRRAGLPRPSTQVIHRRGAKTFARVDFEFEAYQLVVEVSGQLGHASPAERARDAQRRNELQDVGRRVYEYTSEDVTRRPDHVARTLTARLHGANGPLGHRAAPM